MSFETGFYSNTYIYIHIPILFGWCWLGVKHGWSISHQFKGYLDVHLDLVPGFSHPYHEILTPVVYLFSTTYDASPIHIQTCRIAKWFELRICICVGVKSLGNPKKLNGWYKRQWPVYLWFPYPYHMVGYTSHEILTNPLWFPHDAWNYIGFSRRVIPFWTRANPLEDLNLLIEGY